MTAGAGSGTGLAAVVLAAGAGTRLRPLTDIRPKALCTIGGVPMVDLAIAHVRAAGIDDVAVNAHAHADQMRSHFAARDDIHLRVEPVALGTAGALANLRDWIDGRDVMVHNADAWHRADLRSVLLEGWTRRHSRLMVVDRGPVADFGTWRYAGVCVLPWRHVVGLPLEPAGLYEVLWRDEPDLELAPYGGPWFDCGTPESLAAANETAFASQGADGGVA